MPTEIGISYAKAHFAEILRRVELGESFLVTRRGKPVAKLRRSANYLAQLRPVPQEVIDRLMHPRIHGIPGEEVLAWIHEGRK